jgi:hypothetical protein
MAIILRRQLTDAEQDQVLSIHGRKCFATGHDIPEDEAVHFDHIKAFADRGQTEIDNIAPMCEQHNKGKGRLPLYDYRVQLQMQQFFGGRDDLTLRDELRFMHENRHITTFGNGVYVRTGDARIELEIDSQRYDFELFRCPITQWDYFYATLPISALDSDDDTPRDFGLQPRYLIFDKVFGLFRHFQRFTVLQPSICRLHNGRILVFDGQHKIAALLWSGRRDFECKVYLEPDPEQLNQTNIAAHDQFAQTRFFSSILVAKLGAQFGKQFEDYKHSDRHVHKSENGFLEYLAERENLTPGEVRARFRDFLYKMILENEQNKTRAYVSQGNRRTAEKPLTIDMLTKSLFQNLLYREPVSHGMLSEEYKRESEIANVVAVLNFLHAYALRQWNPHASPEDPRQISLGRLFGSKSMMAWSMIFRDALCAKLELQDADDRAMPLYRDASPRELAKIESVVQRLVAWKLWDSPPKSEIDRILAANKSEVKNFFRQKGLTTGYLMGAAE